MEARRFGRYYLLDEIAEGGMGAVYVAVPHGSSGPGKLCALKTVLPNGRGRRPDFAARFRDEGWLAISMSHPNVVNVYETGRVDDEFYLAMELIEGQDLGHVLTSYWRHGSVLPIPAALFVVGQLLEGLDYCHRHTDDRGKHLGLVHRDVAPANLLITYDGHVKLADFGLAQSHVKLTHTRPNVVLGKPGYLAPERLRGLPVDHRADIFAAGVVLFEMLTCERYATSRDPAIQLRDLRQRWKTPTSALRSEIPPEVDELVWRATAMAREERFSSAGDFADAVYRALARLDPVYGARQFSRQVMHTLFEPARAHRHLTKLLRSPALFRLLAEGDRVRGGATAERHVGRAPLVSRGRHDARALFGPRSSSALRTIAAMPSPRITRGRRASRPWRERSASWPEA
ncbi:MAG: serine/threonine protein kinase [Deltaproteobacteria bacterium]|nr:serine/threonine protein kinase [Deltaproteobacteria bacterium]